MANWPNHFIPGKQFLKRPNGNPVENHCSVGFKPGKEVTSLLHPRRNGEPKAMPECPERTRFLLAVALVQFRRLVRAVPEYKMYGRFLSGFVTFSYPSKSIGEYLTSTRHLLTFRVLLDLIAGFDCLIQIVIQFGGFDCD